MKTLQKQLEQSIKLLNIKRSERTNEQDSEIEALFKSIAKEVGRFDNAARFTIMEAFTTDSSNNVRSPSRRFPFSEYKHVATKKYQEQLLTKLRG